MSTLRGWYEYPVANTDGPGSSALAFGVRVKELRTARGLAQQEVADGMAARGFSWRQTTVAKTERAQRPVLVDEAVGLADYFGVPLEVLVAPSARTTAHWAYVAAGAKYARARQQLSELEERVGEAKRAVDEAHLELEAARARLAQVEEGD